MTTLSGTLSFIFFVVFLVSFFCSSEPEKKVQIGDTFTHSNPGSTDNPDLKPDPFVALYVVEEIKNNKARLHYHSVHLDNRTNDYSVWRPLYEVGRFDKKLK